PSSSLLSFSRSRSVLYFFFFYTPRRPPTSPLFPYTTLFRSLHLEREPLHPDRASGWLSRLLIAAMGGTEARKPKWRVTEEVATRSEEHTSELQSLTNLVCRLLLEKKKKDSTHKYHPPQPPCH